MKQASLSLIFLALILSACPRSPAEKLHGQVEWDEIDIASRLSSRVLSIKVELGDKVKAGQLLAVLDDDLIAARNERAQAVLLQAQQQKKMTDQATRREELLQLQSALQLARSQWEYAQQSLKRARTLYRQGAIATQQWEEVQAKEKAAHSQLKMAEARLEAGRNGARDEQKEMAAASLIQAESGLAEVSAYQKDLQLTTPLDATVQAIHVRAGELVPQGFPVLTLVDRQHPRISFFVKEDRLGAFKEGKTYQLRLEALPELRIEAQLVRIQALPPVLTQVVTEAREARDIRSFELTFKPLGSAERLQAGMTATLHWGDNP